MVRGRTQWLGVVTLLVTCSARGDEPSSADRIKAAGEEFDAGRRSYNARDYETAATHFENADRDAPAPAAIRNAIRARSDAKQPARAATLAVAALARYPGDKATAQLARETLAAADKRLHRAQVTCAPACSLLLDGKLTPLAAATEFVLYMDPGPHRLAAGWSGDRNREESVTAEAGKSSTLSFKAPAPPPPPKPTATAPVVTASAGPPPPPPPAKGLPRPVFYTAAGVTAVLAGLATWSAIDMRSDPGRDKVRRDCAGRDENCGTYQDALSAQRRTNVLLAVGGGALLATGVIAYLTRWGADPAEKTTGAVQPSAAVGPAGWWLGAAGGF